MPHKKKKDTPTWVTIPIKGKKLDVLRVWQLNDRRHKWPEVAILRARTTGAKKLAEDRTVLLKFVNDNKIFKKKANFIIHQDSVPPGPPCKYPQWDFVLIHGKASNVAVIQVPCFT